MKFTITDESLNAGSFVHKIINRHLETPGKLIRPQLTIQLGRLFNLKEEDTHQICWASELIHNASLIHDDVVDSALVRRDKPTLNSFLSNSKAVLAGDYLLASVIAELVRIKKYDILKTLAETLEEIVVGEFEQDSLKQKKEVNWEDLESVAMKKTGALIAWNCHSVALCAGLDSESQKICHQLGMKLGLAFQMIDDNLDYSLESGKEYAKDLKEGLINFTTLNLLNSNPEIYYTIYQIKGTKFDSPPWTEIQIEEAKMKTFERSMNLFDEVFKLLEHLADKENISKKSEDYLSFYHFLKTIKDRQR